MSYVINARGQQLAYSSPSVNHFSATGAGPLLEGTPEADSMWGDSSVSVTMAGGLGDDIYYLYSQRNVALEEADSGVDTIRTWMGTTLPAQIENLVVTGDGRHAFGNALDNIITGGSGRQTLDGAAGDDVLIGGAGDDVFVLKQGEGSDLIADFSAEDTLRLTGFGFTSYDEVAARFSQAGDDLVLDLGDGEILVFADAWAEDISADQLELEIDTSAMTLTFQETFDALDLWDGETGRWESNYWWGAPNGNTLGGDELQWYIDTTYEPTSSVNPFTVENGILTITAAPAPEEIKPLINDYDYTSGMLTSYRSFSQTYGYFEVRADMPDVSGLWPAFWLLPADGSWPPELDVIELISQNPNRLILTSHSGAEGEHSVDNRIAEVADTSGFHDYGVLWGPDTITWYFDGVQVGQTVTPEDMHDAMYMLVNLGVGGIAGEPGDLQATPGEYKIDHVRAYAWGEAPVAGHAGDETLTGTGAADTLDGGAGNDLLLGLQGDDLLIGGLGDDTLQGGAGNDTLYGGAGSDTADFSGSRSDLRFDLVADTVQFHGQSEELRDIENILSGSGADRLRGDDGANRLDGGAGNDLLLGLRGDDLLIGGLGDDTLQGGAGNDTLYGGDGSDTADFSGSRSDLLFDLVADTVHMGAESEELRSIENILSGSGADTLRGDDGANRLSGGAGGDNLNGRSGDDLLDGGSGSDYFFFRGMDTAGGDGNDTLVGFEGDNDRLAFNHVIDSNDDGDRDLDDLLAAVSSVTDSGAGSGAGGDVTVAFDNGASLTFAGLGTGATDSLTDLVDDAQNQIIVY